MKGKTIVISVARQELAKSLRKHQLMFQIEIAGPGGSLEGMPAVWGKACHRKD
jgi:hypothetical protein